ncbi:MAG: helix-hairpin-helix domain-containing protein [Prevotellaceae bacterium]|jgi:competence ComEA-like helix-hairpin-helix protein|nr:helix-hairpin-helix domain-containing protein [Prevotellaceae bacterium]
MFRRLLKEWFTFSRSERVGILVLAFLMLIFLVAPVVFRYVDNHHSNDYGALRARVDSLVELLPNGADEIQQTKERWYTPAAKSEAKLFVFNPNTLSKDSLVLLGFSPKQADVLLRYRERGGRFRTADDFFKFSIVSSKQQERLSGVVNIPVDTTMRYASQRAAFTPVELNSADTAELRTISGIGAYYAQQIVMLREKLGGFVSAEQLLEIKYFDQEKLTRIQPRIAINENLVQRLRLLPEDELLLRKHPYIGPYAARGIVAYAKRKGSAPTLDELVSNNILTLAQAQKLKPYVERAE